MHQGSGLLPKIVVTRDISDDRMRRRRSSTFKADMLQMRLLQMEEKYRSQILYDQLQAFEDKVYRCYDQFNIDFLHTMYTKLIKRTVVDPRKVKTLAQVRQCHKDMQKVLKCKRLHRHIEATPEEDRLVSYFTWFFQFIDYLRQLRYNFADRVFNPLFRYFYNIGYDRPDREDTADSATSSPSVMSFRSHDSGFSDISGLRSAMAGDNSDQLNLSLSARSDVAETQRMRRKIITKNALLALSKEFHDIKKLYDTSEIEKLAHRLSHLKDRTDQLLDVEKSLDKDLLGQDSERVVFHLKIKEFGSFNVMRLVPDILIKFQKEAWLARRWLEHDDEKTKDLNAKLDKLTGLEKEMNRRLQDLTKEIKIKETELESHVDMVGTLLKKEERPSDLGESVFVLQKNEGVLKDKLEVLNSERSQLVDKLTVAAQKQDKRTYRQLKPLYDRNKLQRFAAERQIATLKYHMNLIESDINVELDVKTDVIHTTNDMQDKCEELEQSLEKAKKEINTLTAALVPITEDRKFVSEQIQIEDEKREIEERRSVEQNRPACRADYISSKTRLSNNNNNTKIRFSDDNNNSERSREQVTFDEDYNCRSPTGNTSRVSMFLTSLPVDGRVSSVGQPSSTSTPRQTLNTPNSLRPISNRQFVSQPMNNQQFVAQPMTSLGASRIPIARKHRRLVPEVVASEW